MADALPLPMELDPIHAGSLDIRGVDLTGLLTPFSDTIETITSVAVTARDNDALLQDGDLTVMTGDQAPYLNSAKTIVFFWLTSDVALFVDEVIVNYVITVSIVTAQGRALLADATIRVMPLQG